MTTIRAEKEKMRMSITGRLNNRSSLKSVDKFSDGFTLIEIMLAVAILSILAAVAIQFYEGHIGEARISTAIQDIRQVELILDDLASDDNLQALDADTNTELGLYLNSGILVLSDPNVTPPGTVPWLDPWDNIYRYRRDTATDSGVRNDGGQNLNSKVYKKAFRTPPPPHSGPRPTICIPKVPIRPSRTTTSFAAATGVLSVCTPIIPPADRCLRPARRSVGPQQIESSAWPYAAALVRDIGGGMSRVWPIPFPNAANKLCY